jgi:hypothetical protein
MARIKRSASGRSGEAADTKAALAKVLALRPGSTALNVAPPTENASLDFLEASDRIIRTMVEMGLPESRARGRRRRRPMLPWLV